MDVHPQSIQRLERPHGRQQQDDRTASFDGLDCPGEQIGGDCLEVLQNAHPVRVSEDLVRLVVVAKPDLRRGEKELERVFAHGRVLLHLSGALLWIAVEPQLLFVAPEHGRPRFEGRLRQHVVQIDDLLPQRANVTVPIGALSRRKRAGREMGALQR